MTGVQGLRLGFGVCYLVTLNPEPCKIFQTLHSKPFSTPSTIMVVWRLQAEKTRGFKKESLEKGTRSPASQHVCGHSTLVGFACQSLTNNLQDGVQGLGGLGFLYRIGPEELIDSEVPKYKHTAIYPNLGFHLLRPLAKCFRSLAAASPISKL